MELDDDCDEDTDVFGDRDDSVALDGPVVGATLVPRLLQPFSLFD